MSTDSPAPTEPDLQHGAFNANGSSSTGVHSETIERPKKQSELPFAGGARGEEVNEFLYRFETLARIESWSYQRASDELLERCKDEAWRLLTDTVVMGFEPEAIYQTYKQALVSAFAIEPMLAYRQLQQMEFDPTRETIDVYASSILRCLRVLFPDSMKVNLECNGNCIDLCKDQLASKAFWAGLRNYPRLSDLMTQWMTGEKGFANAVRVVRVALSNTGDDQKMIMSYTKNQNGNQKATENNQSEHKNRYTRDKDDKYQKSYYPNKEITKLQCYHCGRRGHSKIVTGQTSPKITTIRWYE